MSLRDPNTIDLTQQKLRLAEDVRVWPVHERGILVYRMEIPALHKFFRVGYEEYVFISLLDGNTTVPQACGLAAATLGVDAPSSKSADTIVRWLLKNELAYLDSDGPPPRDARVNHEGDRSGSLWSRLNPFWMKVPIAGVERWATPWIDTTTWLFSGRLVTFGLFLIALAVLLLVSQWDQFVASAGEVITAGNWMWFVGTWVLLKVIHEFAHAAACHRQGGEVRETGMVFVLFAPLAYVDVTSCWRMNSRWSRIMVASAGMYVELVIAAAAILLWWIVDSPRIEFLLYHLVITAGLSTLLFNANALMRFDGYFILADLIEIPNLYAEGSLAVRRIAKKCICGIPSPPSTLGGWRRHFVTGYGLTAACWRMGVCISLAIAASTMFSGAGIAIAAFGICLWFGRPLAQLFTFARNLRHSEPGRFTRGCLVASILVAAGWLTIWHLPIPTALRVPAVATYLPESVVRSRASGFVSKIHVRNAQYVEQGDLLIELENRELRNRLEQLKLNAQQNEIRMRQASQQHDAAAQAVLRQNRISLNEQIRQLHDQADGLRILAPSNGRVIARELALLQGTYAHEGDPLLTLARQGKKEIIAVIDQDLIAPVRESIGHDVWIRTASFTRTVGRLNRVDPRAREELPERSLAATEGGPLAVRPRSEDDERDSEETYRLLAPHFTARIELDPNMADRIPAGMRLNALLGYRTDPIATRLQTLLRKLWHRAHDQANR